jgi:serine/threonine protein kinase
MIFDNGLNKYKKIETIGKGGYGTIYKVLDNKTNNFYALKFISIVKNNEEKKKTMRKK